MRPVRPIVLMLMTGLLIGAGPVPKAGVPARGDTARSVGRFLTPWREVGPLAFAPDGSSVAVIAGRDHQASLPYAFIYRMDGQQAIKVEGVKRFTLSPGARQLLAYAPDSSKVVVVGDGTVLAGAPRYTLQAFDIKSGRRLGARSFSDATDYSPVTFDPDSKGMYISAVLGDRPPMHSMFLLQADSETLSGQIVASAPKGSSFTRMGLLFSADGKVMMDIGGAWPDEENGRRKDGYFSVRDARSKKLIAGIAKPAMGPHAVPSGRWVKGKGEFNGSFSPDDMRVGDDRRSVMWITTEGARAAANDRPPKSRFPDSPLGNRQPAGKAPEPKRPAGDTAIAEAFIDLSIMEVGGTWQTIRLDHGFDKDAEATSGVISADGKHVGYLMFMRKDIDSPYRLNVHQVTTGKRVAAIDIPRSKDETLRTFILMPGQKVRVARLASGPRTQGPEGAKSAVLPDVDITLVVEDYDFKPGPR